MKFEKLKMKKFRAILILAVVIILTTVGFTVAFFSNFIIKELGMLSGNLSITVENPLIELEDELDNDDTNDFFGDNVDIWTVGDVNTVKYTITNNGTRSIEIHNKVNIYWDTEFDIGEKGVIYVYPSNMSDNDIRRDILSNNSQLAIVNNSVSDMKEIELENGSIKYGIVADLETDKYPAVELASGETYIYSFKIALGRTADMTIENLYLYEFENLKLDLNVTGSLKNYSPTWVDSYNASFNLKNVTIDSTHPIFGDITTPKTLSEIVREKLNCPVGIDCYYSFDTTDNYVWYSGMLWRVMKLNADGSVKMITEEAISTGIYGTNSSYDTSFQKNWLYNYFYPKLDNADNTIVQDAQWCMDIVSNSPTGNEKTVVTCANKQPYKIGLLELYEYNKIKQLSTNNDYISKESRYMTTMTQVNVNAVWVLNNSKTLVATTANTLASFSIRPVINVKDDIYVHAGNGKYNDTAWLNINGPYIIANSVPITQANNKIGDRNVGEYVKIGNNKYRIQEITKYGTVKVILESIYSVPYRFNSRSTTTPPNNMFNVKETTNSANIMDNEVYDYLFRDDISRKKIVNDSKFYIGDIYTAGIDFKSTTLADINPTVATLALPRIGEMFMMNTMDIRGKYYNNIYWTMNITDSSSRVAGINYQDTYSAYTAYHVTAPNSVYYIRPVLYLKSNNTIRSGRGIQVNPYEISTPQTSAPPTIELIGDSTFKQILNTAYVDPGVTSLDDADGDISHNVKSTSDLNVSVPGTYHIDYSVTDSDGNTVTVERTVIVEAGSFSDAVKSALNCSDDTDCYYNKGANNNYVWYSGMLWRIMKLNSDGTVRLITEEALASSSTYYGPTTAFNDSYNKEWLYNYFYPKLDNADNIIVQNATWCSDIVTDYSTKTCTNTITSKIGLLELQDYNNMPMLGGINMFTNSGHNFLTMTPYSAANLNVINSAGTYTNSSRASASSALLNPVINIKADILTTGGDGTFDTSSWTPLNRPYIIESSKSLTYGTTKINERTVGEYVKLNNNIYRITEIKSDGTVKVILDDLYRSNGTTANTYAYSVLYDTLNTAIYNDLFSSESNKIVKRALWYNGEAPKINQGNTETTLLNKNIYTGNIYLPRFGEIFSTGTLPAMAVNGANSFTSTINGTAPIIVHQRTGAYLNNTTTNSGVRPMVTLKIENIITSGNGTYVNPFVTSIGNDAIAPVLTINGEETYHLELGDVYTDEGCTSIDNYDGNISHAVTNITNLNIFVEGSYYINYTSTDSNGNTTAVTRTVIVTDNKAPEIHLLDNSDVLYTYKGMDVLSRYMKVIDNNVDYTNDVVIEQITPCDFNVVGQCEVSYSYTDIHNRTTTVNRTIIVIEQTSNRTLNFNGGNIVYLDKAAVNTTSDEYNTFEFEMYWNGTDNQTVISVGVTSGISYIQFYGGKFGLNTSGTATEMLGISSTGLENKWVKVAMKIPVNVAPSVDNARLYIDGVEQTLTVTGTSAAKTPNGIITLGGRVGSSTNKFSGKLRNVRIWNKEKSDQIITNNYDRVYLGTESNLIYYSDKHDNGVMTFNSSDNSTNKTIASAFVLNTAVGEKNTIEFNLSTSNLPSSTGYIASLSPNASSPLGVVYVPSSKCLGISTSTTATDCYGIVLDGFQNELIHVAFVFGSTTTTTSPTDYKMYINGVAQTITKVNNSAVIARVIPASATLYLGFYGNGSTSKFTGNISDFRLWKGERTSVEILNNMNRIIDGTEPNLIYSSDMLYRK